MPLMTKTVPEGPTQCAVPDVDVAVYAPSDEHAQESDTAWGLLCQRIANVGSAASVECLNHIDVIYLHEAQYACHSTVFSTGHYYHVRFGLKAELADQVVKMFRGLTFDQRLRQLFQLNAWRTASKILVDGETDADFVSWRPRYLQWLDTVVGIMPRVPQAIYDGLSSHHTQQYRGFINDERQLEYFQSRRRWTEISPPAVPEPPHEAYPADDPAALRELTKRLVVAMVNLTDTMEEPKPDTSGSASSSRTARGKYKPNNLPTPAGHVWGADVKAVYALDDAQLEEVAAVTVGLIRDCQYDNVHVASYQIDAVMYDRYPSFMKRFEAVENAFRYSKAAVKNSIEVSKALRICLGPRSEVGAGNDDASPDQADDDQDEDQDDSSVQNSRKRARRSQVSPGNQDMTNPRRSSISYNPPAADPQGNVHGQRYGPPGPVPRANYNPRPDHRPRPDYHHQPDELPQPDYNTRPYGPRVQEVPSHLDLDRQNHGIPNFNSASTNYNDPSQNLHVRNLGDQSYEHPRHLVLPGYDRPLPQHPQGNIDVRSYGNPVGSLAPPNYDPHPRNPTGNLGSQGYGSQGAFFQRYYDNPLAQNPQGRGDGQGNGDQGLPGSPEQHTAPEE